MTMTRQHEDRTRRKQPQFAAAWQVGVRTPAWDALWRRILAALSPSDDELRAAVDAGPSSLDSCTASARCLGSLAEGAPGADLG